MTTKPVRKSAAGKKKPEPNRTKDYQTMVRSSREDKAALHALSEYWGISVSDAIIMLARKEIRKEQIQVRDLDHYR